METITDSKVLGIMILSVGMFLICCLFVGGLIWFNWRNRTNMPDKSTENMPDCLLDKWTENEQTGY